MKASKLIIIEGLDGCGKTELAGQLYIHGGTPLALLHAGQPTEEDAACEYQLPLENLAMNQYTVVCDRWHVGERVWPELFDRTSLFAYGALHADDQFAEIEENMLMMFDEVVGIRLTRYHEDIRAIREINYDMQLAEQMYDIALDQSILDWHVGVLSEFLPGGDQSDVLFDPETYVQAPG